MKIQSTLFVIVEFHTKSQEETILYLQYWGKSKF